MAFKAQAIVVDDQTRAVLEAWVRATTSAQQDVARARIIMLRAPRLAPPPGLLVSRAGGR